MDQFKTGTCRGVAAGPPMIIEVEYIRGQPTWLIPAAEGLAEPEIGRKVRVYVTSGVSFVDMVYPPNS